MWKGGNKYLRRYYYVVKLDILKIIVMFNLIW